MNRLGVMVLLVSCWAHAILPAARTFDVILRNGTLLDGSGGRPYKADVGIVGARIAAIGNLREDAAALDLDVSGLYAAPGFINIHSHPVEDGLSTAVNMLTQGVTTEILNPDGGGPVDITEQLSKLTSTPLAVNAGAYIGFNSIWASVLGHDNRRPTADEIAQMRALIVNGLERGAWGVSSGLDYKPAYFAQTEDVVAVVSAAAPWRTNFTNHDRVTPESNFSSRAGIAETMTIGTRAGLLPVVTHMKAQGREQGTAPAILEMMTRGGSIAADAYPYLAGQSGLGALIIPGWAQEGGREAMLKRFADPRQRALIIEEAEVAMQARFGGPEGVYVTTINRELTDVMRELSVSGGEALVQLLESRQMGAILRFGSEADLVAILQHPTTSIACDCGATPDRATHPRYYGSFPRVLGRYVREKKALTWEEAVRKMTALPAATVGIVDRGYLATGMMADVTVFDPATVIDRATFEQPMLESEGVRHVLVNGKLALRDGRPTGERAGTVLRRMKQLPSRPMSAGHRTFSLRGKGVLVEVRQNAGDVRASGRFQIRDREIEMVEFGVLQTLGEWAALTGRARVADFGERTVAVIFDPTAPTPMLFLSVEGQHPSVIVLQD